MVGSPGEVWMVQTPGGGGDFFPFQIFFHFCCFLTSALWSDSESGTDDKPPPCFCPAGNSQQQGLEMRGKKQDPSYLFSPLRNSNAALAWFIL